MSIEKLVIVKKDWQQKEEKIKQMESNKCELQIGNKHRGRTKKKKTEANKLTVLFLDLFSER